MMENPREQMTKVLQQTNFKENRERQGVGGGRRECRERVMGEIKGLQVKKRLEGIPWQSSS